MRLATLIVRDELRAAVLADDRYVDLRATDPDLPPTVRQLLAGGPDALRAAGQAARRPDAVSYPAADARLAPPVPDPAKIVCLGLNYRDHARESGQAIPDEPAAIRASSNLYGIEGFHLKDVLGVAALVLPGAVPTQAMYVDVETRGELTRGMSVVDARPTPADRPNVDLAMGLDVAAARAYIERTLRQSGKV